MPDDAQMYPSSVEIFYDESKAARDVVDQIVLRYRANATAVLALATGAATFFGFSNAPKGRFFILSLVSYGIAALMAIAIYWPGPWRVNAAFDAEKRLSESPPVTPTKMRWDLARSHQQAVSENIKRIKGWRGLASKFRILLLAMSLVVIFAGINSYLGSQRPTTPKPTHIVDMEEAR